MAQKARTRKRERLLFERFPDIRTYPTSRVMRLVNEEPRKLYAFWAIRNTLPHSEIAPRRSADRNDVYADFTLSQEELQDVNKVMRGVPVMWEHVTGGDRRSVGVVWDSDLMENGTSMLVWIHFFDTPEGAMFRRLVEEGALRDVSLHHTRLNNVIWVREISVCLDGFRDEATLAGAVSGMTDAESGFSPVEYRHSDQVGDASKRILFVPPREEEEKSSPRGIKVLASKSLSPSDASFSLYSTICGRQQTMADKKDEGVSPSAPAAAAEADGKKSADGPVSEKRPLEQVDGPAAKRAKTSEADAAAVAQDPNQFWTDSFIDIAKRYPDDQFIIKRLEHVAEQVRKKDDLVRAEQEKAKMLEVEAEEGKKVRNRETMQFMDILRGFIALQPNPESELTELDQIRGNEQLSNEQKCYNAVRPTIAACSKLGMSRAQGMQLGASGASVQQQQQQPPLSVEKSMADAAIKKFESYRSAPAAAAPAAAETPAFAASASSSHYQPKRTPMLDAFIQSINNPPSGLSNRKLAEMGQSVSSPWGSAKH